MLRLERVLFDEVAPTVEAIRSRNVFNTREWLEFVARTQGAEPVVAQVELDGEPVGAFTGLVVRRSGVRILGSPFQGWMTGPMGFSLVPEVARRDATAALLPFAFRRLGCLHVEMMDRGASFEELGGLGGRVVDWPTFELDLGRDEEELFAHMTSACRRAIRKARREGVRVEEAHGVDFADEYYAQLLDVFEKQGRRPPYGAGRVREMIHRLEPSGNLLMLRAVTPDEERIATAIFPVGGDFAYFWGGASWRSHQILRPNEALFWDAIRRLKERGVPMLDLGGGGDYKRKFGARERRIPILRRPRVPGMLALRDLAARTYKRRATRAPGLTPVPKSQRGRTAFPRATEKGLRPRGHPAEREALGPDEQPTAPPAGDSVSAA